MMAMYTKVGVSGKRRVFIYSGAFNLEEAHKGYPGKEEKLKEKVEKTEEEN